VDFHCDIVGKGRLRPLLRDRIRETGLGDRVVLHGAKSQLEVLDFYHSAHLYVLPCKVGEDGNREGLPVSIVEALACGLPVVSTAITGIPEVVRPGENGYLVPTDDPVELARVLRRVAEDRNLYASLRSRAREGIASLFDRRETIAELHRLMMGTDE
jgi:glycosyltransferase involved in cell wall biosynthesis